METRKCLFLSSRDTDAEAMRSALDDILNALNIEVFTLSDSLNSGEVVSESIYRSIESADFIIADITGSNPNIMYELGLAHAWKKPVLPLVKAGDNPVPFDLRSFLFYVYHSDNYDDLAPIIRRWIESNSSPLRRAVFA